MTTQDKTPNEPALIPKPDGYRKMSDAELALFNEITAHANATHELILKVLRTCQDNESGKRREDSIYWQGVAMEKLQLGYMALKRAVALPANF